MRRLGVVLLATMALTTACPSDGDSDKDTGPVPTGEARCTADTEMDVYSNEGDGVVHTDHPSYAGPLGNPPTYTVDPPSGGDHLSPSVGPGVYEGDNIPPDGVLVHSLEHGYVILWFRAQEDRDVVQEAREQFRRDAIVVQRPSLTVPVAATAWGHRLLCDRADAATLADFVETRRNRAPEKVSH